MRQTKETTEKVTAVEMRKTATEKLSATNRRNRDTDDGDEPQEESPKKKQSHTNLLEVMQQSIAMKKAEQQEHWKIRQREFDLRASELQQQQQFQKVVLQHSEAISAGATSHEKCTKIMQNNTAHTYM